MEEKKKIFIERIGVRTEKMGYSPLAGRILGVLLLVEPPYMSFEELCEYLSASKSSISTNLNLLMKDGIGMVEYFTMPGDRKRYFRISVQNWMCHLDKIPDEFEFSNALLIDILAYRKEHHLEVSLTNELERISSFYQFMMKKLPMLIEEWEEYNRNQNKPN